MKAVNVYSLTPDVQIPAFAPETRLKRAVTMKVIALFSSNTNIRLTPFQRKIGNFGNVFDSSQKESSLCPLL